MDSGFNLLSILTLLGAAQGLFLSLALLNTRTGDIRAHRILALFTVLFSLDLGEEFLYQIGFFDRVPDLLHVIAPIDLCYGPLIYLYVHQLTSPAPQIGGKWAAGRHFIPALVGFLLLVPFFLLDSVQKSTITEMLRSGTGIGDHSMHLQLVGLGFSIFILGTIVQLGLYLAVSIRRLRRHSSHIKNEFSDIDRIGLTWLRNLLLGLTSIFLLYLGDQFFPDLMERNILGDLITVIAVILIYAMGYMGLRQPAIFSRRPSPPAPAAAGDDAASVDKYRRSGLDRETSAAFLAELERHMDVGKPYLEGQLTLPELARQLGISPNYLSQVINEQLNLNFYDFVNGYRVAEAKRLIQSTLPGAANTLQIAFDSGFNSKSAFYTAFKKVTSMTPSQFRQSL